MLKYADDVDLVFQALADPTRRAMVERLGRGALSVGALAEPLAMSLPAVHQHLKVLERSGLVTSSKQGRVRTCRLELSALDTLDTWVAERRRTWAGRLDRLGDFLTDEGLNT